MLLFNYEFNFHFISFIINNKIKLNLLLFEKKRQHHDKCGKHKLEC